MRSVRASANWCDYLTADERARLAAIPAERVALTKEYRQIFDRCRKRMAKKKTQAG